MKSKEYKIRNYHGDLISVKGYPVQILGFEGFEFFVHRKLSLRLKPTNRWTFSEGQTGSYIVADAWTMEAAIKEGVRIISEYGAYHISNRIQDILLVESIISQKEMPRWGNREMEGR